MRERGWGIPIRTTGEKACTLCHTPAKRPTQVVAILEGGVVGVDGVHLVVREAVPPCPVPEDAQHLVHDSEALVGQLTLRQVRTLVQAFQQAAAG